MDSLIQQFFTSCRVLTSEQEFKRRLKVIAEISQVFKSYNFLIKQLHDDGFREIMSWENF